MIATLWESNPLDDIRTAQIGQSQPIDMAVVDGALKNADKLTWDLPPHIDTLWVSVSLENGTMLVACQLGGLPAGGVAAPGIKVNILPGDLCVSVPQDLVLA